jgi:hypothetical protein
MCKANGFHRRGTAFFRVVGDGVLQVLKYEKEHMCIHPRIAVGFFSLYGKIDAQWVTSFGCIPRYELFKMFYNVPTSVFEMDIDRQLELLELYGFEWLDSITDQEALVCAICALEQADVPSQIRWNDDLKYAPYLQTRQYYNAEKVLAAIVEQHYSAKQIRVCSEWEKEQMLHYEGLLNLVRSKNEDRIKEYLSDNYQRNIELCKFCMK